MVAPVIDAINPLVLVVAVVVAVVALGVFVWATVGGAFALVVAGWRAMHHRPARHFARVGVLGLGTGVALFLNERLAGRIAMRINGWEDADGDGMLDPFVNGSYDWVDINGAWWIRFVALGSTVVVGAALVAWRAAARAEERGLNIWRQGVS